MFGDRGAPWWPVFEAECLAFPLGANDDQVDALSGATQTALEKLAYLQVEKPIPYGLGKVPQGDKRHWSEGAPQKILSNGVHR